MTKYQIALEIEKTARILKKDPCSYESVMTKICHLFSKADLMDKLLFLKSQLN